MQGSSKEGVSEAVAGPGERESSVIRVIGEEGLHGFTFEGLKRKLGAHSETLSRILARLEDQGVLQKTGNGYIVTEMGRDIAVSRHLGAQRAGVVLLRTLLPPYQEGRVRAWLMGRWFGPLRWLGYSAGAEGTTMKWITESGHAQVDATFSGDELLIEGRAEGEELSEAIAASHQLVGHISRLYERERHLPPYSEVGQPAPFEN